MFTNPTDGEALRRSRFRQGFWLPAIRAAGLEGVRTHDLRHTYASLAIGAGSNPKEVSTLVGHASVSLTLGTYAHLFAAGPTTVAARIGALIDAAEVDVVRLPA